MKVTNTSARLYHVGDVSIAPGETKEIANEFEASINMSVLVPVNENVAPTFGKKAVPKVIPSPVNVDSFVEDVAASNQLDA